MSTGRDAGGDEVDGVDPFLHGAVGLVAVEAELAKPAFAEVKGGVQGSVVVVEDADALKGYGGVALGQFSLEEVVGLVEEGLLVGFGNLVHARPNHEGHLHPPPSR